ncbi:MAG: type II toxin-antitoxin system RelE/ParE family toxin [Bacteroidota bacterium]
MKDEYQVVFTSEATEHIMELVEFYDEKRMGLGDQFVDSLGEVVLGIKDNPRRWQYVEDAASGMRRAIIRRPSVVILYQVVEKKIIIGTIKDARSNWK